MAERSAPAQYARKIVSGVALDLPCNAIKADAQITATSLVFEGDSITTSNYVFEQGYNPIGVKIVTYDNTAGDLWALYN